MQNDIVHFYSNMPFFVFLNPSFQFMQKDFPLTEL